MLEELRAKLGIVGLPFPPPGDYPDLEPRLKPEFEQLVRDLAPRAILEMGSWEGRSAIAWLDACRQHHLTTELVCVDTWLGSAEHWLDDFPNSEWSKGRLRLENDSPHVYDTFCHTLRRNAYHESVVAMRMTNRVATDVLVRLGYSFDLVYVDGAHDFRSVVSDLLDALTLTGTKGAVIGDDWGWPSVSRAAKFVALVKRARLFVSHSQSSYALMTEPHRAFDQPSKWKRVRNLPNPMSLRG